MNARPNPLPMSHIAFCALCSVTALTLASGCGGTEADAVQDVSSSLRPLPLESVLLSETAGVETIRIPFEFTNPFDVPVRLTVGHTNCSCFEVTLPKESIGRGQSASVDALRRRPDGEGKQSVGFTLIVSDADSGAELAQCKGDGSQIVLADNELAPNNLFVTFKDGNEPSTQRTLEVVQRQRAPTALDAEPASKLEFANLPPEMRVVDEGAPAVTTTGSIRETRRKVTFEIQNDDRLLENIGGWLDVKIADGPTVAAHYRLLRAKGVRAMPEELFFTETIVGERKPERIYLVGRGVEKFDLAKGESSSESFSVGAAEWDEKRSSSRVEIVFHPLTAGKHETKVRLTTTCPDAEPIEVRIIGNAVEASDDATALAEPR